MNRKRLRKLADFLMTLPAKRFNLVNFAEPDFEPNKCGTTACACGWATVALPKSGFKLYKDEYMCSDTCDYGVQFGELKDWDAIKEFFGISKTQAFYLFIDENYPEGRRGPKSVAKRIYQFLDKTKTLKDNSFCPKLNYKPYPED